MFDEPNSIIILKVVIPDDARSNTTPFETSTKQLTIPQPVTAATKWYYQIFRIFF